MVSKAQRSSDHGQLSRQRSMSKSPPIRQSHYRYALLSWQRPKKSHRGEHWHSNPSELVWGLGWTAMTDGNGASSAAPACGFQFWASAATQLGDW